MSLIVRGHSGRSPGIPAGTCSVREAVAGRQPVCCLRHKADVSSPITDPCSRSPSTLVTHFLGPPLQEALLALGLRSLTWLLGPFSLKSTQSRPHPFLSSPEPRHPPFILSFSSFPSCPAMARGGECPAPGHIRPRKSVALALH